MFGFVEFSLVLGNDTNSRGYCFSSMHRRAKSATMARAMADFLDLETGSTFSMSPRRWVAPAIWVVGGLLVAYAYAFISATTVASEKSSECTDLVTAVTAKHAVPLSISEPGRPAVFCDLGVHFPLLRTYDSVFIYGVLDKSQQDSILVDLRSFHRTSHAQSILVQFFEKENWKTWSDPGSGRSGGSRGPETPILKVWVN